MSESLDNAFSSSIDIVLSTIFIYDYLDKREYNGLPTSLPLPIIRIFLFFISISLDLSIYKTA